MKKIWNGVCVGLGFLFFCLGAAGAVMPVLPATPFLLAAAFFFAKGSTRFHQWFVGTNLYRRYIEQAVKHKAMDKAAKRNMLVTLGIVFVIGFLFLRDLPKSSFLWWRQVISIISCSVSRRWRTRSRCRGNWNKKSRLPCSAGK